MRIISDILSWLRRASTLAAGDKELSDSRSEAETGGAMLSEAQASVQKHVGSQDWTTLMVASEQFHAAGGATVPERLRMVLRDLPPDHAALRKANEEVAFFRSVAENVADYVAVLDTQGRRLYNSASYEALFGDPNSLRGTDSFQNIHPDDREHVKATFSRTVESGIGRTIEYRFILPNGSIRHMESRGAVILDDSGQVDRVIVTASDITERKALEAQMREYAYFDPLTGLPNRRMLLDRIQQSVRLSRRSAQLNALLYFDLDDFKRINDDFGHAAGDLVLIGVGRMASTCIRESDTVARLGGDEYVVLINQLDSDPIKAQTQVEKIAEKLRQALAAPHLIEAAEKPRRTVERYCPASIGAVLFGGDVRSPDTVLQYADAAMYLAKHDGGDCVRFEYPDDSALQGTHCPDDMMDSLASKSIH